MGVDESVERQSPAWSLVLGAFAYHTEGLWFVYVPTQPFTMTPSFHLVPERRDPPDLERFVAALLAFTLARMEAEEAAEAKGEKQSEDGDD
ncbi:MAG: hypothetical protein ACM3JL_00360 [Nitrososphaerota archaeon]